MPRLISRKLIGLLSLLIPTVALAVQVSPYLKAGRMDVDNIRLDGNTVSTLNTNGSLTFDLNGTGGVLFTDLTATTVPYLDAGKKIQSSAVTPTELGFLSGVTMSLCGTGQTCTLSNKTLSSPTITTPTITAPVIDAVTFDDQASAPSNPSSGFYKFYVKTDGSAYVLDSGGIETAVGAGGGTNEQSEYITNGKFESSTNGWATYADAAASSPVDGTAGTATSTIARTTTAGEILKGTASLEFAKPASNEQGEGFSYDFTVDPENYSNLRPVYLSFDYKTTTNYASSDVKVFVYDKDGAALLSVLDGDNLSGALPASTGGRRFTGVFYPSTSTSNDYRLIFHVTSTNASAYDLQIDSVHAGSQVTQPGAIITDWVSFTPTGSWVANSTYTGRWRRVGDSMEVIVNISLAGAPTSTGLTVNLPSGYTIDTNKIVAQAGTIGSLGSGTAADSGVATYGLVVHYNTTSSVAVYAMNAASTYLFHNTSQVTQALPVAFGSPDQIEINFKVPISNWTSGASLSTTEMLQSIVRARYSTNAAQSVSTGGSGALLDFEDRVYDTHSAVTTGASWKFTAPKTGYYRVRATILWTSTGNWNANEPTALYLYKNGVVVSTLDFRTADATISANMGANGGDTIYLTKGDYISIYGLQASGSSLTLQNDGLYNFISIEEIPDFSVFTSYPVNWYINAYLEGASPSLGTSNVTSYTEITNTGLTLTPLSGSAPVGTMCSAANPATAPSTSATTCGAGSESVGINFAIPTGGVYEVCFDTNVDLQVDQSEMIHPIFQLIETPTSAQTLTLEGGPRTGVLLRGGTTSGNANEALHSVNLCGVFNWMSVDAGTVKGVRLMYEQEVSGTPNGSALVMDASTASGQRHGRWRVRKY